MPWHPNRGRNWPIHLIRKWIEEGRTHAWIGERLGCAAPRISKLCQKHGIKCQRRGPRGGTAHPDWKGGRQLDKSGYVLVYMPNHPNARHGRYVLEHRLVMERHIGRRLKRGEVVHHKNGDKTDNRIENLELFATNGEHLKHELTGRCPNWTPEGRERILEAVRSSSKRRRRRARGGPKNNRTNGRSTDEPDSTAHAP